jgi:hypothetical protein
MALYSRGPWPALIALYGQLMNTLSTYWFLLQAYYCLSPVRTCTEDTLAPGNAQSQGHQFNRRECEDTV